MKLFRSRILPLAVAISSAAISIASAQTTATTTPVGFITLTVPAASSAALSVPLYNTPAFQSAISGRTANTISFSGTPLTDSAYIASPYLVRMMSGNGVGRFFLITANTNSQLTVNTVGLDLTTLISNGDIAQIVAANTLSSLFGANAGTTGFVTSTSVNTADTVFLWDISLHNWATYYNDGSHWRLTGNGNSQDATIVYPDEGVFITRISSTPLTLTVMGTAPSTAEQSELNGAGSSFVPNRFPVDIQLANLGFQNSPGWTAGATVSQADNLFVWNGTFWDTYYYNGQHWFKVANKNSQDATVIPAGTAVFINRANASSALLTQSLPYTP